MVTFEQMRELVHQDVLQALHRFRRELYVQPDAPGPDAARALIGFH